MAGVVEAAWLARASLAGGETRLLLALAGVPGPAQAAVSSAVAEAVRFAGDADLDVVFAEAGSPLLASAARSGTPLPLPRPGGQRGVGPGMDPDRPPRLRHAPG